MEDGGRSTVMRLRLFGSGPGDVWKVLAVLALFAGLGMARWASTSGDDLAASYIGCRLMAAGEGTHLYSHDAVDFSEIGDDDAWQSIADGSGFDGYLHPYVQTPMWAYALEPLCTRTRSAGFTKVFAALTMLSFAGVIFLAARYWTPELLNPYAVAVIAAVLWVSEPFRYAMFLMQTHVLFVLLTLGALMLAERRRPWRAGLLLAGAAAVKITPGFLLIYWLITRRWRALGSMVVCSAVLWAATVLLTGRPLVAAYLADLHRVSGILLISQNNQSFASWWMGRFYTENKSFDLRILALPKVLGMLCTALVVGCVAMGGWIDRRRGRGAPVGAMMALVGMTIFAPIGWTHYYIVLIAPVMVLLAEGWDLRVRWILVLVLGIILLNVRPIAGDVIGGELGRFAILRSHFYSGVLCLLGLAAAAWERSRVGPEPPVG